MIGSERKNVWQSSNNGLLCRTRARTRIMLMQDSCQRQPWFLHHYDVRPRDQEHTPWYKPQESVQEKCKHGPGTCCPVAPVYRTLIKRKPRREKVPFG